MLSINGDEPRNGGHGKFYLRAPHEPVVGIPDLPEQWAQLSQGQHGDRQNHRSEGWRRW